MQLVFIGHLTIDDVIFFGKPAMPDCPGGAALYSASGAYMWQHDGISLISRLGTDFDTGFLKEAKLDLRGVKIFDEIPTIHLFTLYDRKNLRYFIVQRWAGSYDRMAPTPDDFPAELNKAENCFHIAAFPLPRQQAMIEAVPEGAILSVDPHHDYIYPEQHDIWNRLLKKITVFQPSEDELIRFFSIPAQPDIKSYLPYMKRLSDKGPRIIVLKLGERGALGYDAEADSFAFVPAVKTPVVDVTGCGDCFCGGFMASYIKSNDLKRSLICGSVSASFNITHYGVTDNFLIPLSAVEKRFEEFSQICKGVNL